jgi:copper chaperone CopZ
MSPVFSRPYSSDDDNMIDFLGDEFFEPVDKKRKLETMNCSHEVMPIEHVDKKRKVDTMTCSHEVDLDDMMMEGAGAYGAVEEDAGSVSDEDEPTATAIEIIDLTGDSDEDEESLPALRRSTAIEIVDLTGDSSS